jgi:hypothetical protein
MTDQFPAADADVDTDLDVQFGDVEGQPGWRCCAVTGRVGGYVFDVSGFGSRDERALAFALEQLARRLNETFPRLYLQ